MSSPLGPRCRKLIDHELQNRGITRCPRCCTKNLKAAAVCCNDYLQKRAQKRANTQCILLRCASGRKGNFKKASSSQSAGELEHSLALRILHKHLLETFLNISARIDVLSYKANPSHNLLTNSPTLCTNARNLSWASSLIWLACECLLRKCRNESTRPNFKTLDF